MQRHPEDAEFLSEVPSVQRPELLCAESALLSVMGFWNAEIDLSQTLWEDDSAQPTRGRLPTEVSKCGRSRGYATREASRSSLAAIGLWLESQCPVITLRRIKTLGEAAYHFDVIVGYDDVERALCVMNSTGGSKGYSWISYEDFGTQWTGYTLVLLPEPKMQTAIRAQEQGNRGDVEQARALYRDHLEQFPADTVVAFNLARLESPDQARKIYEGILALHPGDGPTLNNLARVLGIHFGQLSQAQELLDHAARRDPLYRPTYERTARELGLELKAQAEAQSPDSCS